jgi:hypothetical protein
MSTVTVTFGREHVPQWETGLQRWCILEVFLCAGAIAAVNFLEYHNKKQMISGFPKGSTQETDGARSSTYKESKKDDPNNKKEDEESDGTKPKTDGGDEIKP